MSALPSSAPVPAVPVAPAARKGRWLTLSAWFFLCLSLFCLMAAGMWKQMEHQWLSTEAEVMWDGHAEVRFCDVFGKEHGVILPQEAAAWKQGDKLRLHYYLKQPQYARLDAVQVSNVRGLVEWVGFISLVPGVILGLWEAHRQQLARRKAARVTVRRSVLGWFLYALAGLLLGLAIVCAFLFCMVLLVMVGDILYLPDANGGVMTSLAVMLLCLVSGVALRLTSRTLIRRDRRTRQVG